MKAYYRWGVMADEKEELFVIGDVSSAIPLKYGGEMVTLQRGGKGMGRKTLGRSCGSWVGGESGGCGAGRRNVSVEEGEELGRRLGGGGWGGGGNHREGIGVAEQG